MGKIQPLLAKNERKLHYLHVEHCITILSYQVLVLFQAHYVTRREKSTLVKHIYKNRKELTKKESITPLDEFNI